jgi:alkylhydroperoxidase family enzyme
LFPVRLSVVENGPRSRVPSGLKPAGPERFLFILSRDQESAGPETSVRLPMLTNEEAWKRMPGAPQMAQPLPGWMRLLAGPLPLTTSRMLELDALHRTGNRLDAKLRGLVRWAAADANRCSYAKAVAAADLRRAAATDAELQALADEPSRLSPAERVAVAFARKLMREAHAVTDNEVKQLLQFFGEERVVALVALLAHASFQDRIFLSANVLVEPGEPLPPLTVPFANPEPKLPTDGTVPEQKAAKVVLGAKGVAAGADWLGLQVSLDQQRVRVGRIRVPSREEVLRRIGDDHPALWQADILWSRVCYAFQPELTDAWFACSAAFRQEAGLDRVFEQCIFWVITRSQQCFY